MSKITSIVSVLSFALVFSIAATEPVKPLKVPLVIGGRCHDHEKQQDLLSEGSTKRANVEIQIGQSLSTS